MATPKPLLLACLSLLCISISYSQWTQSAGPEGGYTNDIVKVDNTLIVSAGGGGVYISTNNGASWEPSNEGLPLHPHVYRIASHGDNVYISLYQGGVYRSVDKGSTWSPANNGADRLTFYSLFTNGQEIYAGSADGKLYYSADYGANWSEKNNGLPGNSISGFVSYNSKMYVGTADGLFESVDNGNIWNAINIPGLSPNGIQSMTEYNGVFYVTNDGQMFVSNDNLASWILTPLGGGSTLTNLVGYEGVVYTTNSFGRYYYSSDNGVNWTMGQNTQTDSSANNILLSNDKLFMLTGEGVFESFDDGSSWTFNSNGIKAHNISALAANDTYLFTGTSENGIFRSSDNGATWTPIGISSTDLNSKSINDIIVIDNTIFAATSAGIYTSNDNGDNWVIKLDPGVNKSTSGLDYDNGILATIIGGAGVYISSDLGETWTLSPMEGIDPTEIGYTSILIRDEVIVVSTANSELFVSDDMGQTWSNISIPDGFFFTQDLEFIDNRLYAATAQGVMASDDLGETWYRFLTYGYNSVQDIIVIDNTIYGATDFGLYASEEGRDFWYPFTEGTKNEHLTEILLKDGTLFAGTFGSSLWSRPLSEIVVPPLDDDNDGVINEDDLCPGTPWGSEVDSNGCAASQLDDDNDGITNDLDLCADTPVDAEVDSNGCAPSQLDDDNDGITNDLDLCADTPADAEVDSNGCAASQLDDDNDGITNDLDLCADTPVDAEVDSNGCAASQLDDDKDGVANDLDLCTDTPADAEVDSNGCAASQLDDDNDGVANDLDLCPNTSPGITVNSNGCDFIAMNAISIYSETPSCPNVANGSIEIATSLIGYNFDIAVSGEGINENYTGINLYENYKFENLAAGTYEITVAIPSILHEQYFGITINGPSSISGKLQGIDSKTQSAKYIVSGSTEYTVDINGIQKNYIFNSTEENEIEVHNLKMSNEIHISGINDCQGKVVDTFSLEEDILVYPTLTSGQVYIFGGFQLAEIRLYNSVGQLVFIENWNNMSESVLHLDNYTSGLYIVHIITEEDTKTFKIIKQ
ncbi:MAG: T9SS type A sorting domain-containing protein [Arenibacter sp.]